MRGPVGVAIDMSGTLGNPSLRGLARASGGHVESAITGTAIDDIRLDARFDGSSLDLTGFSGRAGKGGISGSGRVDLSFERGFPIDIAMQLDGEPFLAAPGCYRVTRATGIRVLVADGAPWAT